MNIVTFCQIDESLFNPEFKVEYFHTTGTATDADIVIIDIDSIFEFEENKLVGDVVYPTNEGILCSKGVSELISIQTPSRLLRPLSRETLNEEFKISTWSSTINKIATKIAITPKEKIGFYLSGQLLTEDYYVANKLMKGFIGTNNVDTNSRTCMSSAVVAYKKSIGADYVPVRMNDVHDANLLILVGANTAEAHVVFHNRIKTAKKQGLKIIVPNQLILRESCPE